MVKSTLSNLLIDFMSLCVILHRVATRLEKIQRNFLWGGRALEQRPHLVN